MFRIVCDHIGKVLQYGASRTVEEIERGFEHAALELGITGSA